VQKIILNSQQSTQIKKELNERGITHQQIAKILGVSRTFVSGMLNGTNTITTEMGVFIKTIIPYSNIIPEEYVINKHGRISKIEVLLTNTKISWYWLGFLLADGNFSKDGIFLSVCDKDLAHLEKFRKFTSHGGKLDSGCKDTPFGFSSYNKIFLGGKEEVGKLMEILYLTNTCKTYNPPTSLPTISREKLISLFIGFIDGDGSISKRKRGGVTIEIEIHVSWKNYLNSLITMIYECCGESYSNKIEHLQTTVKFCISNPIVMKFLKNKIKEYSLPILQRKWDNLDEVNGSRFEEQRRREKLFPALIEQGYSLKDLADFFHMNKPNVCRTIKRLGLVSPSKR